MKRLVTLLLLSTCIVLCAQDTVPSKSEVITREVLEKRIQDLQAKYNQTIADANAIQGAIQDCQYWLDQLKKTPEVKK